MKKNIIRIHSTLGICGLLLLLFPTSNSLLAQNIIGGSTGDPSAVLDLRSNSKGLLLPRMTTEERSAIVSPAEGLLIYNTSLGCVEINLGSSSSPDWLCMLAFSGRLASLDCSGATHTGTLRSGEYANGVSSTLAYDGGSGGFYDTKSVSSTGVTGLTATLTAGALANGSGSLTYTITGTPSGAGTANFALSIGGQSCILSRIVEVVCGAYIAAGVWKEFMCYNLGANMNADPLTPSWELTGNYYQWGRNPTCFGRDGIDGTNPCGSPIYGAAAPWGNTTANDNAGVITGWSATSAPSNAWQDDVKTANDPCPAGFRVPTRSQLEGVITPSLNNRMHIGAWTSSSTYYESGIKIGESLFLPAAGYRDFNSGMLSLRGSDGIYRSSTESTSTSAWSLDFNNVGALTSNSSYRTFGFSIRCIRE